MCSTVGTCKSGRISISFHVSSVSVSVPASRSVPSTISRSASDMAYSMISISFASSAAPVIPDSDFAPVLLLLISNPVISLSWRTLVIYPSFSPPVLSVSFSSLPSSPASDAYLLLFSCGIVFLPLSPLQRYSSR